MKNRTKSDRSPLLRLGDLVPILLCVVIALAIPVWQVLADDGAVLCVTTPKGIERYALGDDGTVMLTGKDGHAMTLLLLDGKARVAEATCPDQVCVHTGWLQHVGDTAACLPAGILITVEGEGNPVAPDAIAR